MTTVFLFCALVGGTILVCQFVLTLIGLGDTGFDIADDVPDGADADMADIETAENLNPGDTDLHGSSWLFGIISFRTLVAAATFFGLTGMAASTGGLPLVGQMMVAISCGLAAMFGVHWLMRTFFQLGQSGTLRIGNTIGRTGTVHIPIPEGGTGKVQMRVQDRLEEFPAVSASTTVLSTGAKVVVVGVVSGSTVQVRPIEELADTELQS